MRRFIDEHLQERHQFTALLALLIIFSLSAAMLWLKKDMLWQSLRQSWHETAGEATLSARMQKLTQDSETALQKAFIQRRRWIDLYGLYQKAMGKRVIEDPAGQLVLKDNREQLHFYYFYRPTEEAAENYRRFSARLDEMALPHHYVQLPNKKIPGYSLLPTPFDNYANESADDFLAQLQQQGLDYSDYRPLIYASGIAYEEMFYRTDHHWQTETALWTSLQLIEELEERTGWQLFDEDTPRALSDYQRLDYPQHFLGSQGVRTGRYYAGVDDFSLFVPRRPGSYELYYDLNEQGMRGDFRSAFIHDVLLETETDCYAAFLGYDTAQMRLVNTERPQGKKLAIIKDSYTQALAPYLAAYFREIILLDMRAFHTLDLKLGDHLQDLDPDYLLVIYSPDTFDKPMFSFDD